MNRIILQPTGKYTKEDFIHGKWISWAEQEKYEKLWKESIGDTVLFIKDNYIFLVATITDIEYDYETNEKYPLRYYFNNLQYTNISLINFNEIIGYSKNFIPRKYMIIKEDFLEEAFNYLNNYISKAYDEKDDLLYQEDIQEFSTDIKDETIDEPINKKNLLEKNGTKVYPRNIRYAKISLQKANFMCEVDARHITFKTKSTNQNYTEAHHLIPLNYHNDFNFSLDVPANIVSLCPSCHRMIHLGKKEDVKKLLSNLYNKRIGRLEKAGLSITLDELEYIYENQG